MAESKYVSERDSYDALIDARDSAGLERLLTRPEVEERILVRVSQKVEHLQSQINPNVRRRISAKNLTDH